MRRHVSIALTAAALAALASGCGSTDELPAAPAPHPTPFDAKGISFVAPAGWTVNRGTGHLIATVATGEGTVAIWRFPRKQELPDTKDELRAARDGLVDALTSKDDAFEAIATAPTEIAGQPAVQIRAHETIAGVVRTVRTSHIYAGGAEYVVDAYTDDSRFRDIDARFFRPILRSMKVEGSAQDTA
ncbi:MAG TPA: hypothetical protein VFT50_18460 [Baekduia sp.]|nr:hypothetical protein [Baekduia sp.]